jgi:formylglycine-generating enzyme required for sulfatase activity
MGSPFYMAPDQWGDDEPDAHADIYRLGVILYQMLAGEVPFKGSSIPSIMKKHLTMPPPSFQSMGVSVPPAIEAVVRHSLEKEIGSRIDTVENFLKELRAAIDRTPVVPAALRETVALDPNRTIASTTPPMSIPSNAFPMSTQAPISNDTNVGGSLDSLIGEVSAPGSGAQAQQDEERERRDKEQQEKLDRMAQQAKDLEDRLERLSGSMGSAGDPESTRVQGSTSPTGAASTVGRPSVVQGKPITVDFGRTRKGPPILLIAAAVGVFIIAGIAVTAYLAFSSSGSTADPRPTPSPSRKADQVAINGGTYMMGRDNGLSEETPAHSVTVKPFMMDRTEVSNNDYAEFVAATNRPAPSHWVNNKPAFGQEQWPVVNVSFDDAVAFAAWRSKRDGVTYRLPTEEEWEYAARNGQRADLYPWGSDWVPGLAVLKEATPAAVGSRPGGANQWGVTDLIGNVWEWTSSKVSAYPGNQTVIPTNQQDLVAIRGGCYVSDPANPEVPVSACLRQFVAPTTKTTLLGFRLVRSGS